VPELTVRRIIDPIFPTKWHGIGRLGRWATGRQALGLGVRRCAATWSDEARKVQAGQGKAKLDWSSITILNCHHHQHYHHLHSQPSSGTTGYIACFRQSLIEKLPVVKAIN
jgi:hypothetical protein